MLRHTHQRLPVSLVSIGPQGVATASHEGNIHRYMYKPPASPSTTDNSHPRRISSTAANSDADRSQRQLKAQEGSFAGSEGATQAGRTPIDKEGVHVADALESMQGLAAGLACPGSDTAHQGAGSPEVCLLVDVTVPCALCYALHERHPLGVAVMVCTELVIYMG